MNDQLFKIIEIVIYLLIGLIFFIIGYKVLSKNKHYNLNDEIDNCWIFYSNGNSNEWCFIK